MSNKQKQEIIKDLKVIEKDIAEKKVSIEEALKMIEDFSFKNPNNTSDVKLMLHMIGARGFFYIENLKVCI